MQLSPLKSLAYGLNTMSSSGVEVVGSITLVDEIHNLYTISRNKKVDFKHFNHRRRYPYLNIPGSRGVPYEWINLATSLDWYKPQPRSRSWVCKNAIETATRHSSFHHQICIIGCRVVASVFINHTHKVEKMFPSIILVVYYIKNKKSGKRSENYNG